MPDLTAHAAWALSVAFVLSFAYEAYRATAKAGTSRHDSVREFWLQSPLYAVAAIVVVLLFVGASWTAWLGLAFSVGMILVSIFYYNPRIMMAREPAIVDWVEDLVFTGLLFVAATMLTYEVSGTCDIL